MQRNVPEILLKKVQKGMAPQRLNLPYSALVCLFHLASVPAFNWFSCVEHFAPLIMTMIFYGLAATQEMRGERGTAGNAGDKIQIIGCSAYSLVIYQCNELLYTNRAFLKYWNFLNAFMLFNSLGRSS